MKANIYIVPAAVRFVALLFLIVFHSCGTYNSQTSDIESNLFNGDFNQAVSNIDNNKFLLKDRNRLLYLMEKGKVEHLRGNYEVSNTLLEEAYIIIDYRIKTSVGQAIAAKVTNPMAEPYKGEDFEKVTLHYYKALNYFQLGLPNAALVEAKRINLKLYQLNEKYSDNKNKYSEDAFSQILQGILYEATGDINNAFIAYRNAEEIYGRNNNQYFGVPLPEQLKKDLIRTTKQLGFREEHELYQKKYGNINPQVNPMQGEAIIFWENGLAPAKDQVIVTASAGSGIFYASWMDGNVLEDILIPVPPGAAIGSVNAIAIPKYTRRESYYSKASLVINNTEQQLELAQDFNSIAKQCLKDRMLRETIDLIARFAVKKAASEGLREGFKKWMGEDAGELAGLAGDLAGAVTEKADTRNWQTLPSTISYTRVPLKQGENKFVIKKYGAMGIDTDTIAIAYKEGLQIVNYFDLGRTEVLPNSSTTVNTIAAAKHNIISNNADAIINNPVTNGSKASYGAKIDTAVAEKYNKWFNTGNGVSYKMQYYQQKWNNSEYFVKEVYFTSSKPKDVKITYAVTQTPLDEKFKEVSVNEYYDAEKRGEADKLYFKRQESIVRGKEAKGFPVFHKSPDVYVTILNVE